MPPFEVSDELEAEQQQHHDQEGLDCPVQPRRRGVRRRVRRRDSAVGGAYQRHDPIRQGGERAGDLLELEEADPGQLSGAPGPLLLDGPIGGGGSDLDAEEGAVGFVGFVE